MLVIYLLRFQTFEKDDVLFTNNVLNSELLLLGIVGLFTNYIIYDEGGVRKKYEPPHIVGL